MPLPGSAPVAINRVLHRDSAFDRIVEVIQNGTLVPGEKLTDDHLISCSASPDSNPGGHAEACLDRTHRIGVEPVHTPRRDSHAREPRGELRAPRRLRRGRRAPHRRGLVRPTRRSLRDRIAAMSATGADDSRRRSPPSRGSSPPWLRAATVATTVDVMGPQVERVIFNALIALDDDLWDSAEQAGDCAKRSRRATRKPRPACCTTSKPPPAAIARLPKAPASQPW